MQKATVRFQSIMKKIEVLGVDEKSLARLDVCERLKCKRRRYNVLGWNGLVCVAILVTGLLLHVKNNRDEECLLEFPFDSSRLFREPVNCDICVNVTNVEKISKTSPEEFDEMYVRVGRPVIVTDATRNWMAVDAFSFDFFRELYRSADGSDESRMECQFFPYKTEFKSLAEVFNMSDERANFKPGTKPWYIGWSNCNDDAGKILRNYYSRPYFLPQISEDVSLNCWMFMGGSGFGAHMHVDDVNYPSWQAQIKGRKTWIIAPPPECYYKCDRFEVTVEPGEIIVIDTNKWYHQTNILPGSISITIGSEFD